VTLYAYIPNQAVVSVGELPASAVRDSGQLIHDLPGANVGWARACRYFDVDDPDLSANLDAAGLTGQERDAALAVIDAAVTLHDDRVAMVGETINDYQDYIAAIDTWAGSVTPDPVADFADWATYINDQLFAVSGYVAAILGTDLLVIPTVSEALEQLGLVQVVTVSVAQEQRWIRSTTTVTVS
jgi:hypothetical protein